MGVLEGVELGDPPGNGEILGTTCDQLVKPLTGAIAYSVPLGVKRVTDVRCPVPLRAETDTLCSMSASRPSA